ncbi:MAG: hypothetical protein ABIG84_05505 [archaeon]
MDLGDCWDKGYIKKTKPNKELVKSLIEMSDIKEKAVNSADIDELTVSAYVPMAYDSLREVLEAICISRGYKVTSHVCIGELIRTFLDDFDFHGFDRFRYIRNGINYYGEKVDFKQGIDIIKKMFDMKKELLEGMDLS